MLSRNRIIERHDVDKLTFLAWIASQSSITNQIFEVQVLSRYSSLEGSSTAEVEVASWFEARILAPQSGEA